MTEQEFLRRLGIVNDFLHYVEKTLNTTDIPINTLIELIKIRLGIDLNKITDKNKWFTCSYDVNGLYCKKVKIGREEKKGTYLRDTFFSYDLRSSAYTISYNKDEDNFIFTVKGYGHGVGMSQAGANQYAKSGWNYEQILKHYFTGLELR